MNAISLRQPWAWAICHAGKRVENRDWCPAPHTIRRPLAIHTSKTLDEEAGLLLGNRGLPVPAPGDLVRGAVVAVCMLSAVVQTAPPGQEEWWAGPYGLVLSTVVALEDPVPTRGLPGMWVLDHDTEQRVMEAVRATAHAEAESLLQWFQQWARSVP